MATAQYPRMQKPRVINSQMNISLPIELHDQLRENAWLERKTISAFCREILELGMQKREEQEREAEVVEVAT